MLITLNPGNGLNAILTTGYRNPEQLKPVMVKAIEVLPQKLVQNDVDLYDDYNNVVSLKTEGKNIYFMLVNRRTEYISMVNNPTRSNGCCHFTPINWMKPFSASTTSNIKFIIINSAKEILGKICSSLIIHFRTVFYSDSNTPEISIDPGDGRF